MTVMLERPPTRYNIASLIDRITSSDTLDADYQLTLSKLNALMVLHHAGVIRLVSIPKEDTTDDVPSVSTEG